MSAERCWSFQADGRRCAEPAVTASHFCPQHTTRGGGINPLSIWRAPVDEMPPDLVAAIRRAAPEATFPPSERQDEPAAHAAGSSDDTPSGPLDWLLDALRQTVTQLLTAAPASDSGPTLAEALQKATAMARLGALAVKAHQAAGLERAHRQLLLHVVELEQRLAGMEMAVSVPEAAGDVPAPADPGGEAGDTRAASGGGGVDKSAPAPQSIPARAASERRATAHAAVTLPARASP